MTGYYRGVTDRSAQLLERALGEAVGAALVLDLELKVRGATPAARALLGEGLVHGVSAPKFLCGEAEHRPIAEALAQGRPVRAEVVRPTRDGLRTLMIRATPLSADGPKAGWLLTIQPEGWTRESSGAPVTVHGVHTQDPGMIAMLRQVERVGRRDVTVLVRGETGTGKELIARAVHAFSSRADGPFHAINCAALPPDLLESQLFGHVRGAFTGAIRDEPGHFRLADKGTIFLDEVAELSLPLQAKLLRVVQQQSVYPVGAREAVPVDVRVVSATHRALREEVEAGRFRADLMYRLRVVPLRIPPLRNRDGDVAMLARLFSDELCKHGDRQVEQIAPGAIAALAAYDWPGNVRELQNALEYAFAMGDGPVLTEADLPPEILGDTTAGWAGNAPQTEAATDKLPKEARRILTALERAAGHRGRAAQSLGISRVTLWRKIKEYGLQPWVE